MARYSCLALASFSLILVSQKKGVKRDVMAGAGMVLRSLTLREFYSVNSQTPGGTALLNTQIDDNANSVVISVSDVSVLPIRLVDAVYLQIEDEPSTLHIETEVVRVLRIGACSGVGSTPSGLFPCTYSPNEINRYRHLTLYRARLEVLDLFAYRPGFWFHGSRWVLKHRRMRFWLL
jgi:hypothetical protein